MNLLYEKIADLIEERIKNKVYAVSSRLPGEDKLAGELKISRSTLHKALRLLKAKGLINCRPSIGNFVLKIPRTKRLYAYVAPNLSDPFHAEFIRLFNMKVVEEGGSLLIDDNSYASADQIVSRLKEENVDGVVYCPGDVDESHFLKESGIPALWLTSMSGCRTIDYIAMNNEQGIKAVLQHLCESGIKSVGYAKGVSSSKFAVRKDIFLDNVESFGLATDKNWILEVKKDGEEGGKKLFQKFINLEIKPDALVFYNDWNAIGFIETALNYGMDIPGDLRVTGFDNLPLSKFYKVPLTTVDYHLPELVAQAHKMLSKRITNVSMKRQHYIADCSLIVRKS